MNPNPTSVPPLRSADAGTDASAPDRIEGVVDAAGFEGADEAIDGLCARLDGNCAKRAQRRVFRGRGSAVRLQPGEPQQLQRGRAHTASRAGDQRRLPGLNLGDAMDHLPRGHIIQNHSRSTAVRDSVGDRDKVFGLAHQHLREASVDGQRRHTLSHCKAGHARADCVDHAGDLVSGDERNFGRVGIFPREDEEVGRAHARGAHPHPQLPRPGSLHRQFNHLQVFRRSWFCQHHCAVGCGHGGPQKYWMPGRGGGAFLMRSGMVEVRR